MSSLLNVGLLFEFFFLGDASVLDVSLFGTKMALCCPELAGGSVVPAVTLIAAALPG